MQSIPQISNTSGIPTTLIPLTFVVVVDAVFAVLEDIQRHKADNEANGRPTLVYRHTDNMFQETQWNSLQVGDLVKVSNREQIPADLCIVGVCESDPDTPTGICYVETKSLDGETNLKMRQCPMNCVGLMKQDKDAQLLKGEVQMEHPNRLIESFTGVLELDGGSQSPVPNESELDEEKGSSALRCPLQPKNLLLRGCVLRNTQWIIGLVLNTGHDTKENFAYFITQFFYYFLLLSNFIPISLYVTMSTVKFFQAKFISMDIDMYHEPSDTPAKVRTFTLNEELGQITHIFSDKTGTLTENIMEFRKCSINGFSYGRGLTEIGKAALKEMGQHVPKEEEEAEIKARENKGDHVAFYDDTFFRDLEGKPGAVIGQSEKIEEFFRVLAVCHTINSEKIEGTDRIQYSASSPDDEALVCGAKYFGWEFRDRQDGAALIFCHKEQKQDRYEILEVMEFTSKRKRMSVIVRNCDGELLIFSKGADTVMRPRLKAGQEAIWNKTAAHMTKFAVEGLRTLVICCSPLNEKVYFEWQDKFSIASNDIEQIDLQKAGEDNEIDRLTEQIEQNLELLGCTAIEDKLQDGVGLAIADLVRAGIKIWMLTGDKEETAINIAVACKLILPVDHMERVILNETEPVELEKQMDRWLYAENNQSDGDPNGTKQLPRCLIVDGPCLVTISEQLEPKLLDLAQTCKAVVGCRVSPAQKRQMVKLIKEGVKGVRTLAIGDGANDVAMIQEAHVGVGISGQEGMQAVNSSDYAIAQFRFLRKLLLVHGRWNYRRMSKLVCYVFYKNILMSLPLFWYAWANGFGGQKFFPEAGIQLFNMVYTAFPIVLVGIYDQDISADFAQNYPGLYFVGIHDTFFTDKIFWVWIFSSLWEACLISIVPLFACADNFTSLYEPGLVTFTAVVFICNLKLIWNQFRWTWFHLVVWLLSILCWFLTVWVDTSFWPYFETSLAGVFSFSMREPKFWFCLGLITLISVMRDIFWKGYDRAFQPKPHHIIEEIEVFSLHTKDIEQIQGDQVAALVSAQERSVSRRVVSEAVKSDIVKPFETASNNTQKSAQQIEAERRISAAGYAFSVDDQSEVAQRELVRSGIRRRNIFSRRSRKQQAVDINKVLSRKGSTQSKS